MYSESAHGARTINVAAIPARGRARSAGLAAALLLIAAHAPLAIVMRHSPPVATAHALLVFVFGMGVALFGRKPMHVAYVAAYIIGAEVLWRMSDARVPWEFGKYATVALFAAALVRLPRLKPPALPVIYFALLLPATLLTFMNLSAEDARQQISFNLSGPLALAACAVFFAHVKLARAQLTRLFLSLLAPVFGVACVALFGMATAANLSFGDAANSASSGGFGPNQVSAALGLGFLIAFWLAMDDRLGWRARVASFAVMLFLVVQCALTFSRGGLYAAGGAILLAALFLMRTRRARLTLVAIVVPLLFVSFFFVLPHLDAMTGGAFTERYQDTSLTGRDVLIQADLIIWLKNPVWGVGPGRSALMHLSLFRDSASHTEFSRMLAEHAALGLASMLLLFATAVRNVRRARGATAKGMASSFVVWGFLFMASVAMRMAAPSFLIGLTFARLLAEDNAPGAQARGRATWSYALVSDAGRDAARGAGGGDTDDAGELATSARVATAAGHGSNVRSFYRGARGRG
ncbi:MAG: O-antigen ligase family protein [Pyrinomonadaceae bacterium]